MRQALCHLSHGPSPQNQCFNRFKKTVGRTNKTKQERPKVFNRPQVPENTHLLWLAYTQRNSGRHCYHVQGDKKVGR
jgi:hypothetical protein